MRHRLHLHNGVLVTYRVVPNHVLGPAVISDSGWLVDYGPLKRIERICAALNAAETDDMHWAVPEFAALEGIESERVLRALSRRIQMLTSDG